MNKAAVYILLAAVLIVGLVVGYVGATLLGPAGAGEVRNARLQVGDEAPDLRLRDHTGRFIQLSDYRGEKNVFIAFLPGALIAASFAWDWKSTSQGRCTTRWPSTGRA